MAGNTQDLRGHDAADAQNHPAQGDPARGGPIHGGGQGPAHETAEAEEAGQQQGMRAEAIKRVQIGLGGLAGMALLVGLANIIMTSAQQNQAQVVPAAAPTVTAREPTAPVSDPLADMGVVPDLPAEAERAEEARAARATSGDAPAP